jgi:hypothetical protein
MSKFVYCSSYIYKGEKGEVLISSNRQLTPLGVSEYTKIALEQQRGITDIVQTGYKLHHSSEFFKPENFAKWKEG